MLAGSAAADHHGNKEMRRPLSIQGTPPRQNPAVNNNSISNRKAASLVKKRYSGSRILGVSQFDKSGAPMYRVRTLSPNGVVKSVLVDGQSGELID